MADKGWKVGWPCEKHDLGWCGECKPSNKTVSAVAVSRKTAPALAPVETSAEGRLREQRLETRRRLGQEGDQSATHAGQIDKAGSAAWRMAYPLRPWQQRAIAAWIASDHRGVVEAATGTGKTAVALAAASELRAKHGASLRVVIVVPTQALASQWSRAVNEELRVPMRLIGEQHSASRNPPTSNTNVLVTVINTARTALAKRVTDWERVGCKVLVIVDECHRAGSEWNAKVVQTDASYTLGLSATPERSDGGHQQHVYPGLGYPVYRYPLLQALDDGVLAKLRSVNLYVDFRPAEQREWDDLGKRLGVALQQLELEHPGILDNEDRLWGRIGELARREDSAAMRVVSLASKRRRVITGSEERARCLRSLLAWVVASERRSIIFHETIKAAKQTHAEVTALHSTVSLDHSELPRATRDRELERFRKDHSRVLVAVRSLDEGIDVPDASVAIIASGSRSKRQRIQRLGRILRRSGEKEAIAISIHVRGTPEESLVGARDQDLIGVQRTTHHRWPGRPVDAAITTTSYYTPFCDAETLTARVTAAALEIAEGREEVGPAASLTDVDSARILRPASTGGYVAATGTYSLNAWHDVAAVRLGAGMPPEEFDRLRPHIRLVFRAGLDPQYREDTSLVHGSEIAAIQRRWEDHRRRRSKF